MRNSKKGLSLLTLQDPSLLSPFDPDETTRPGVGAEPVKALFDRDERAMLGKIAAEVTRQGKVQTELVSFVNDLVKALNERTSRETMNSVKGGSIVGAVVAIFEILKAVGVIK